MKKPVHSSIMSVTGKLAGGLMPALIIVFAFIFCPPAAAAPHLPKDDYDTFRKGQEDESSSLGLRRHVACHERDGWGR